MINKNTSIICQCLSDSKIPHIVGGSSLLGLATGVLTKYTNNISLYIFNYNQYKIFFLFFRLLKNGILLKPKFNKLGILRFKLRKKKSIFEKNLEYCTLFPGKIENNNYKFFIGGRYIYFESDDLQSNKLSQIKIKKFTYTVPQNYHEFNEKYNDNLFSGIYRKFPISFNSKTEIEAISLLENVVNNLEKNDCKYWLDGGTLLGAVRDKQLIPWDHDLDIGIKYENDDILENLITQLRKKYYIRALPFKNHENIWNLGKYRIIKVYPRKFIFFREKLCLDLFIFYPDTLKPNNQKIYKYVVWNKNAYYDYKLLEELSTISFYGREYSTPGKTIEYLEAKYGHDWKIPKENWNVIINDKSVSRQDVL